MAMTTGGSSWSPSSTRSLRLPHSWPSTWTMTDGQVLLHRLVADLRRSPRARGSRDGGREAGKPRADRRCASAASIEDGCARKVLTCRTGLVSSPLRTPASAAMLVGGTALGLGALVTARWRNGRGGLFDEPVFLVLAVCGLGIVLAGAWVHDEGHRRLGEVPHAFFGHRDPDGPHPVRRLPWARTHPYRAALLLAAVGVVAALVLWQTSAAPVAYWVMLGALLAGTSVVEYATRPSRRGRRNDDHVQDDPYMPM